ncbi:MAG: fructose-6-phosphate aldolase, partial [Chloroflexi bacterium]|nr:fructose-6-phosphate aldolase [Chloroflexota bacterium]
MRIFLDTANVDEIREAVRWGVCDGVTTNPTLFAKESGDGVTYRERILEIAEIVDGPISAECVSRSADELVVEARELASWHPNV